MEIPRFIQSMLAAKEIYLSVRAGPCKMQVVLDCHSNYLLH